MLPPTKTTKSDELSSQKSLLLSLQGRGGSLTPLNLASIPWLIVLWMGTITDSLACSSTNHPLLVFVGGFFVLFLGWFHPLPPLTSHLFYLRNIWRTYMHYGETLRVSLVWCLMVSTCFSCRGQISGIRMGYTEKPMMQRCSRAVLETFFYLMLVLSTFCSKPWLPFMEPMRGRVAAGISVLAEVGSP